MSATDERTLDGILRMVGGLIPDEPEAWACVAMGCLDQAGLSLGVQEQILGILARAGVHPEASAVPS